MKKLRALREYSFAKLSDFFGYFAVNGYTKDTKKAQKPQRLFCGRECVN
jgi:hypothetical protein